MQYLTIAETIDEDLSAPIGELEAELNAFTASEIQDWMNLGRTLEILNEWKLAVLAYQEALQREVNNPDALALMANALEKSGKDGYPYLALASEIAPDSALVRAMLAVYWQLHDKPDKSIGYLTSLAEDFPEESAWQENIALVYLQEDDIVNAYDHFVAAVNLESLDPDLWLNLARFCIQYNIYIQEVGLPSAREALALAPNDPEAMMVMGQVLMLTGDADNSVLFLQRAYSADPHDPAITYFLAGALLSTDQMQDSFGYYIETITLAGESSYGLAARQMLEQFFSPGIFVP
jgi:tetratricopeptide (TPR) repeat protein